MSLEAVMFRPSSEIGGRRRLGRPGRCSRARWDGRVGQFVRMRAGVVQWQDVAQDREQWSMMECDFISTVTGRPVHSVTRPPAHVVHSGQP